MTLLLFD